MELNEIKNLKKILNTKKYYIDKTMSILKFTQFLKNKLKIKKYYIDNIKNFLYNKTKKYNKRNGGR
jgi:hypothetical protein